MLKNKQKNLISSSAIVPSVDASAEFREAYGTKRAPSTEPIKERSMKNILSRVGILVSFLISMFSFSNILKSKPNEKVKINPVSQKAITGAGSIASERAYSSPETDSALGTGTGISADDEHKISYIFNWNEVPGSDSANLLSFLKDKFKIDWSDEAEIRKSDDGKSIIVARDSESLTFTLNAEENKVLLKNMSGEIYGYILKEKNGLMNIYDTMYLFSWDDIPGGDSMNLLNFLKDMLKIDWVDSAEIKKSDDGKIITITKDENSIMFQLDREESKAKLKNGGEEIYEYNLKEEDGKINIYDAVYLFCWDDVPGKNSTQILNFLKDKFKIDWTDKAKIRKSDDGKAINIRKDCGSLIFNLNTEESRAELKTSGGETYEYTLKEKDGIISINNISYLFCWDDVPGSESEKLLNFLKDEFKIKWVDKAKIKKSDDKKTITITGEGASFTFNLNSKESTAVLKTSGMNAYEYLLKEEDGKINIYATQHLFSWDDVPGKESTLLLNFLKDELKIDWADTADIKKSDNDKTIAITRDSSSFMFNLKSEKNKAVMKTGTEENYEYMLKEEDKLNIYEISHIFSWDDVPGNDSARILNFLKDELKVDLEDNTKIKKSDDNKNITIAGNNESLIFSLNRDEGKAILETSGGKIYEYILKEEKNLSLQNPDNYDDGVRLNVYNISYLFSWDDVIESESEKFLEFLKDELKIIWTEDSEIKKSDGGKIIIFTTDDHSIIIKLDRGESKAFLKIRSLKSYEYILKKEDGKLNICESSATSVMPVMKYHTGKLQYVAITPREDELIYSANEPLLKDEEVEKLKLVENVFDKLVDIEDMTIKKDIDSKEKFLKRKFDDIVSLYNIKFNEEEKDRIFYFIERDFLKYGRLDVMMNDRYIEDISCNGPDSPVYVFHRNYGSIKTSLIFKDAELNNFILRLSNLCNKHISVLNPITDASLPDGSRINMTLGFEVTKKGSTFTIRKFKKEPISPVELMNFGTLDSNLFAYIWMLLEYDRSILVSGGTASGKTTLLNGICMFVKPQSKIVSIEDTPEINIYHPNWIQSVSRSGFGSGGGHAASGVSGVSGISGMSQQKPHGDINLYDLLVAALRQRPDYIIVGEVRGTEAFTMFQAIAVGHSCMGTIHARNIKELIGRVESVPMNVPRTLFSNINLVIFIGQIKTGESKIRRVNDVVEVLELEPETNGLITNSSFRRNAKTDSLEMGRLMIFDQISKEYGIPVKDLMREHKKRREFLQKLKDKNIYKHQEFTKKIVAYHINQNK